MWSKGALFLGLFALFFALSSAVPAREFYAFDEPEEVVLDQFNHYEEFVAGQDYEFKEHSYDGENGVYRFRHSKAVAKRTIVNLDKLNVKHLRCNSKRNQLSLTLPAGDDVAEKLDGKVIFFQRSLSTGCGQSRGYFFVESVETDDSSEDEVKVKAKISEADPKELLDTVDATFYQEDIRHEVARVFAYEEEDAELSSSDIQESAPEEVRQKIREIQEAELHHVRRYKKRFFSRLWDGLKWIGSKVVDIQQKVANKFEKVKNFLKAAHTKKFPADGKNGKERVYKNKYPITWSREWDFGNSIKVNAKAEAMFEVDFCFAVKVEKLILKTFTFTLGARGEFTGGLTVSGTLEKAKNFKSLTAGATLRIPTVVAPGLSILLNPYVRLEGQAKVNVKAKVDFTKMFVMPRWTKTWIYGEAMTAKLNGESPQENSFKIKPLKEDAPYTGTAEGSVDLFITPILGLQVGLSALDLFDLMGGPIVKVPLHFSAMAKISSSYTTDKLPSCVVALHFSLAVQAGITVEFKVLGISAISKEWVYTFRRGDQKADVAMKEIKKAKQEPGTGHLATKLEGLRREKLAAEEALIDAKVQRRVLPSSEATVTWTLTQDEKNQYKLAFKKDAPDSMSYRKWSALGKDLEKQATDLENLIFEKQVQIDEISIPALIRLRDDFVRDAVAKAPEATIPPKLKADFERVTTVGWDGEGMTSDGNRYRLISHKLKEMEVAQKEKETEGMDGVQKKLVFFSFCLYEAVVDGSKHKFQFVDWLRGATSSTADKPTDSTFPKFTGGPSAKWKNEAEFQSAFLLAERRGPTDVSDDAEEDKAEKHGWQIIDKDRA